MKLAKQSTFGNTAIVGNITYRLALTYLVTFGLGALLHIWHSHLLLLDKRQPNAQC